MEPVSTIAGRAVPLLRRDIDTDVIVRIERLTQLPRGALGPYAFEALRGPDFPPDQFRHAPILLAGANFGCGSSREGAVWAMQEAGLRCVIAPSFGDIFFSNCFQNGMLPVVLPEDEVAELARRAGEGASLLVDLPACTVAAEGGRAVPFTLDPLRRQMLLEGTDELGLTLKRMPAVGRWRERDRHARPWAQPDPQGYAGTFGHAPQDVRRPGRTPWST